MFKKTMALAVFCCLPLLAQAEETRTNSDLDRRLLRKTETLNRAIEQNLYYMSPSEKRDVSQLLDQAIQIARGVPSENDAFIKFNIESQGFVIEAGRSLSDTLNRCKAELTRVQTGRADDISVEIAGQRKTLSTSGWWTSTQDKCQIVTSLAAQVATSARTPISFKRYVLAGKADSVGVIAEGNSLRELKDSCLDLTRGVVRVDDISVSLNGGSMQSRSTSAWWTSAREVCETAISLVF